MSGAARRGRETRDKGSPPRRDARAGSAGLRTRLIMVGIALAFASVAGQLARLAGSSPSTIVATVTETTTRSLARPDIADRAGRLIATDIEMPSLYADPSLVRGVDDVSEQLATVLADLNTGEVRRLLSDRNRRFVWLRRGLSPRLAQEVHDLGLPGLAFRTELRRAYPLERLAGHVLGSVNVDNRGTTGIEKTIDEMIEVEPNPGTAIRLSLDLGVQHAVEDELRAAMERYQAKGAAGLVMDVNTGELLAAASLPGVDPSLAAEGHDKARLDKIQTGSYELGSIFKLFTVAMALEGGETRLDTVFDVTKPLTAGRFTIKDVHPAGRPLTVSEIFIRSSNVGAALLALAEGPQKQKAFLDKIGLTQPMRTEAGPVAAPQLPAQIGRAEQITLSYGHGIAVAPIQFAAAAAAMVNGGTAVAPTFLRARGLQATKGSRVISEETSRGLSVLLRRNVAERGGTGTRAEVPGFRVGGKTGTAEMPGRGGYQAKAVVSSFLAAFPMDAPQYVVLVLLFEPQGTSETNGEILAGRNAAPTAGRMIARVAPMLGVKPEGDIAQLSD